MLRWIGLEIVCSACFLAPTAASDADPADSVYRAEVYLRDRAEEVDFPEEFLQLYVEQGASLDLMSQPLFYLPTSSVRRYLEIGCGFGFSVDFAGHGLGWSATGLEPSRIGQAGRAALGFTLQTEYLDEQTS